MSWYTARFHEFPGLDWFNSVDSSTGALEALDVALDIPGQVRSRGGFSEFYTAEDPASITSCPMVFPFMENDGGEIDYIIAAFDGTTNEFHAIDNNGNLGQFSAQTYSGSNPHAVAFGDATSAHVYATGGGSQQIYRFEALGTPTWAAPASLVAAGGLCMAVQLPDNRLVIGAQAGSGSKVAFSNAGDPETFDAGDFVLLHPGTASFVSNLVSWRGLLFAFKQDEFFVFYGNSVDATGGPVFNYRAVEGQGAPGLNQAVATDEGVYFTNGEGVWLTTGGSPTKVSGKLDGWIKTANLASTLSPWYDYLGDSPTGWPATGGRIAAVGGRLIVDGGDGYLYVREDNGEWVVWLCRVDSSSGSEPESMCPRYASYSSLSAQRGFVIGKGDTVYTYSDDGTTDNGNALTPIYRTGFQDLGEDGEKRLRAASVWGTGTGTFALSRDFAIATDTATSLTLGTFPSAAVRKQFGRGKDGTLLSWKITLGAQSSVLRVALEFQPRRPPGSVSP